MKEFYWEPRWRTTGIPQVGDYVQILIQSPSTLQKVITEGMVIKADDPFHIVLVPYYEKYCGWGVMRWRKRIFPELVADKVVQTTEA